MELAVKTVLTIGTFDIPHMGHAAFLNAASELGDQLIVGVNSDRFVQQYKGSAPVFTFSERSKLLHRAGYRVAANDGAGHELIRMVAPDILAIGSDWMERDYLNQIGVTQSEWDGLGIALVFVRYTHGISTSEIKRRLRDA